MTTTSATIAGTIAAQDAPQARQWAWTAYCQAMAALDRGEIVSVGKEYRALKAADNALRFKAK